MMAIRQTPRRRTTPLTGAKNIGPVSASWLHEAGIRSQEHLHRLGAVKAYERVRAAVPERVTLNLLYALHGAILGVPWYELPDAVRDRLRRAAEPRS
jgi:DNA transformation protein